MKKIFHNHSFERVHLIDPSQKELFRLGETYHVHPKILEDIRTDNMWDKMTLFDDHIFMVLHYPSFDTKRGMYFLNELNVILNKDVLITAVDYENTHIEDLRKRYKKYKKNLAADEVTSSSLYIVVKMLDKMLSDLYETQNILAKQLQTSEDMVLDNILINKDLIKDLVLKRRSLVRVKECLIPQQTILSQLCIKAQERYGNDITPFFSDIEYKLVQNLSLLAIMEENTQSLLDTYNSLANVKTNTIVSVLTIFTAMTSVMMLITGFFGMNMILPLMGGGRMFVIVIGMMVFCGVIMAYVFKKHGWI